MEPDKPKKNKFKLKSIKLNKNVWLVVIVIGLIIISFFIGSRYGANQQKQINISNSLTKNRANDSRSRRWASIGTILEISDTKIKIKDSRDQEKEASISKETEIVGRKADPVKISELKKDRRVILSGEKDGDKLAVKRIRVQN